MHYTLFVVLTITLVSVIAFYRPVFFGYLQLNPHGLVRKHEWHRIIGHAFIHADWMHLIINMLVLYSFGTAIENYLAQLKAAGVIRNALGHYMLIFFGSAVFSSILTIWKHRNNPGYNSVGASGIVAAYVFASIFFAPWQTLLLYFIPIPGIVFGALYLGYSQFMSMRKSGHINHDAHFMGAVFGFLYPLFIDPGLIKLFLYQLTGK